MKRTPSEASKYLNNSKYRELEAAIQTIREEVEARSHKLINKVQYEIQHVQELANLIHKEAERKEARYDRITEEIRIFKRDMASIIHEEAQKNKLLEGQLLRQVKIEIDRGEAMLEAAKRDNADEMEQFATRIGNKINEKLGQFQELRVRSHQSLRVVKEVAEIRIKKAEEQIRRLKQCHEKNSKGSMDNLFEVYARFHRKIQEQKSKRVTEKREFLDLIDKSIEKLKEVVDIE